MTFVSLGYQKDNHPETQNFHGSFQIHGIMYHMHSPLEPQSNDTTQYAQLFFYYPAYATNLRHNCNPELDLEVLGTLTDMLHWVNLYIPIYKIAREQLRANPTAQVILTLQFRLVLKNGTDKRQHNLRTTKEIAIIITGETDQPT